jgi:SAM-dependent methyltransferase
METITAPFYDFPKYYDLVYGSDWKAEYDFLQACFKKHAIRKVGRLFEPACGTGRLLVKLAAAGYEVSGNDLNPKAVAYCNTRLERHGYPTSAMLGDMSDFHLDQPADAAFNTINSFRHLTTESDAYNHLRCMAEALRPGGLYVLGLHLTPTRGEPIDEESWSARRGNLTVLSRLWVTGRDRRKRQETIGMSYDIYTPTRQFRILDHCSFRTYTARQLHGLLERVPEFEVTSIHDFGYDINRPIEINSQSEDVVLILRKS